ncbi:unnamed protein product [Arabidopsis halleri]
MVSHIQVLLRRLVAASVSAGRYHHTRKQEIVLQGFEAFLLERRILPKFYCFSVFYNV